MAMIMSPYGSGGGGGAGGDNSVQSIMQRLRLQPGVVRVGAPAYAGGGSPLAAASAGLATGPGHVMGPSGGQDDNVNARLSDGEYIMDADTVSNLGDGNNAAGAAKLDAMRQNIRAHKRSAPPSKIPPKAKKPEAYLKKSAASAAAGAAMGRRGR
jgi:hypothetical protein